MVSKLCFIASLIVLCCFRIEATRTLQSRYNSSNNIHHWSPIKKNARKSITVGEQIGSNATSGIKPQGIPVETDHCYAVVRTNDEASIYVGASGSLSLYNPIIHGPQWSATRMRLQNGDESIEAGWMVNEDLFKDNRTHLYIRLMVGGKGCFNHECQGFVQVAKDIGIGSVPDKLSRRVEVFYVWRLSIEKHADDGNWWLSFNDDKYGIGYWPKRLFTSLANHANQVEWGGEVYYPSPWKNPPEMGCGYIPDYDTRFAAFYANTKVVDGSYRELDPPLSTVKFANCDLRYVVQDAGYKGSKWGRTILFGGPVLS